MTQMKKHIITIAGMLGSGKSTTAKLLSSELGYAHYSTGGLFRDIANSQQMDLLQANLHAEKERNSDIDFKVDERQRVLGETEDNFIIDGRLAWHFIPQSFKVYLKLDTAVGARRILADMDMERRDKEHVPDDPDEYAALLDERLASESRRYKALYNVDGHDRANFDLVVDTKVNSPEQVKDIVLKAYHEWLAH
jgi:cytidylate kinase